MNLLNLSFFLYLLFIGLFSFCESVFAALLSCEYVVYVAVMLQVVHVGYSQFLHSFRTSQYHRVIILEKHLHCSQVRFNILIFFKCIILNLYSGFAEFIYLLPHSAEPHYLYIANVESHWLLRVFTSLY